MLNSPTLRVLLRFREAQITYQSVSRLVLVNCTDSRPIEVRQQRHAGSIECVLGWHHPEEVREAIAREHRMRIRVAELQWERACLFMTYFMQYKW